MKYAAKVWTGLRNDRRAVTALEYCLIAAVIALIIIGTAGTLGVTIQNAFITFSNQLRTASAAK